MSEPRFIQLHSLRHEAVRAEIEAGLLAPRAAVSPKFFYDALGSRLFDAITELDEYDLTRTEAALMARWSAAIADEVVPRLGPRPPLVDLGAGNCAKAARLFPVLRPARYVAVDISVDYLREALKDLQGRFADIDMVGLGMDFSGDFCVPDDVVDRPSLLFYPGSSIGNFAPPQALRFLSQAREASRGGALLVGVDLLKPASELDAAYDDALGVTAAFNRNALRHVNRLLGADFQMTDWAHLAKFDADFSRVDMHLVARRALTVRWPGHERPFAAGERIHTEHAYKWTVPGFKSLLAEAGFDLVQAWTDERHRFAVMLAWG